MLVAVDDVERQRSPPSSGSTISHPAVGTPSRLFEPRRRPRLRTHQATR